jgi:hypothetical protein
MTTRLPAAITPALTPLGRFGRRLLLTGAVLEIGLPALHLCFGRESLAAHMRVMHGMTNGREGLLAEITGTLAWVGELALVLAIALIMIDRTARRRAPACCTGWRHSRMGRRSPRAAWALPGLADRARAAQLGDPPQGGGGDAGGEGVQREEAGLVDLHAVDADLAGYGGAVEVDRVALALLRGRMTRDEGEILDAAAKLLPDLADRSRFGRLERADAAAGEHEQGCVAVGMADQQQLARRVEDHHLHPVRMGAQDAPDQAAEAVEGREQNPYHPASLGARPPDDEAAQALSTVTRK